MSYHRQTTVRICLAVGQDESFKMTTRTMENNCCSCWKCSAAAQTSVSSANQAGQLKQNFTRRRRSRNTLTLIFLLLIFCSFMIPNSYALAKPIVQKCATCRFLVKTFKKGLKETARGKFDGGDAAWESEKLGKYARSETRLVEVMERLCKKDDETKLEGLDAIAVNEKELEYKCHTMGEEIEEQIENWYFHKQTNFPDMESWLCVDTLKLCCPWGYYGEKCDPCPGDPTRPCFLNGNCDGSGSRTGKGECDCFAGYQGKLCRHCTDNYYPSLQNETHIICTECHESCKGCTKDGPSGCKECKSGWRSTETACEDIDECSEDPCNGEYEECENIPGTYECNCIKGYKKEDGNCVLDVSVKATEEAEDDADEDLEEENEEGDEADAVRDAEEEKSETNGQHEEEKLEHQPQNQRSYVIGENPFGETASDVDKVEL